jgi:hypothetical protein
MTLSRWMRGVAAVAIVTAFAAPAWAPAWAQSAAPPSSNSLPMPGIELGGEKHVDPATAEKRKEIDRAYRDATRQIPAQAAATTDPWANMRGANETKPAPKPAARTTAAQKKKPLPQ